MNKHREPVEGILDGKTKYAEKNLSQPQLVQHKYRTDVWYYPDYRGNRQATKRLSESVVAQQM